MHREIPEDPQQRGVFGASPGSVLGTPLLLPFLFALSGCGLYNGLLDSPDLGASGPCAQCPSGCDPGGQCLDGGNGQAGEERTATDGGGDDPAHGGGADLEPSGSFVVTACGETEVPSCGDCTSQGGEADATPTNGGDGGGSCDGDERTWRSLALPYASGASASAVLSDGLHYLGGATDYTGNTRFRGHHIYDALTRTWRDAGSEVPDDDTWGAAAHTFEDRLYLVGGYPDGNKLRVYDPTDGLWQRLPDPPIEFRWGFASGIIGEALYVFGGAENRSTDAPGFKYEFATRAWTAVASIPKNEGYGALSSAVVGDLLFVLNGGAEDHPTAMQIYSAAQDSWRFGAELPEHAFESSAALADGHRVLFFGGAVDQDASDSRKSTPVSAAVNVYDTLTDSWSSLPSLNIARMWATAQIYDGHYYVLGGLDSASERLADYEVFER